MPFKNSCLRRTPITGLTVKASCSSHPAKRTNSRTQILHQSQRCVRGLSTTVKRSSLAANSEVSSLRNLRSESLLAERKLTEVLQKVTEVLQTPGVPQEGAVLASLRACEEYAKSLVNTVEGAGSAEEQGKDGGTPAADLLYLDEQQEHLDPSSPSTILLAASIKEKAAERISTTAYSIITSPTVFITPALLQSYVHTQSLLGRPETLPQAFTLYANKPIPRQGKSSAVQYTSPSPSKASSAVPLSTANMALSAAIEARNLPLCLDIILTTVCTPASQKSKIFRRAMLPLTGLGLAPLAAYTLASQLAVYQDSMDNATATNVAFVGILAYVGFTSTIGIVAITTANDQMVRVTWVSGMRLRERWIREEERAMIDRVACAWGFKESWRRGEEEGEDWEALKEWTGLRGMMLDRVELMEGME
ncbi:hypothetical protein MMC24_002110 [Lignoscripta atroalba]|nr:hypothetical protein [Lignoscripta atroalba]